MNPDAAASHNQTARPQGQEDNMPKTFITHQSHLDHSLTFGHLRFLLDTLPEVDGFTIKSLELPEELPSLPCALYGPVMGDEPVLPEEYMIAHVVRGDRPCESRMIVAPMRPSRIMTVIIGPDGMLYTAFGGPPAEREPGDPSLADDPDAKRAAEAFWKVHALAGLCSNCVGQGCAECAETGLAPTD
jgi:hypothetical protein